MRVSAEALLCTLTSSPGLESDSSVAQYPTRQQAAAHCTQLGVCSGLLWGGSRRAANRELKPNILTKQHRTQNTLLSTSKFINLSNQVKVIQQVHK